MVRFNFFKSIDNIHLNVLAACVNIQTVREDYDALKTEKKKGIIDLIVYL